MDSIKSLMDNQNYDLVIKLTENSTNVNDLFYRLAALVGAGRAYDAIDCIEKNRKLLENDMAILIKFHIETLCLVGQFDKAYEEIKYYENLPYVSQEVEELLKEMPNLVRSEEKKTYGSKSMKDEEIRSLLHSPEYNDVLIGLDIVRNKDIDLFIDDIKDLMINHQKQSIRSFSLFILVQKKYDKDLEYNRMGDVITVNPSKIEPPFVGEKFNNLVREIQIKFKNPTLSETAIQALSTHIMYTYPEPINDDIDALLIALYRIACEYTSTLDDVSLEDRCFEANVNVEKVKMLIEEIKYSLTDF